MIGVALGEQERRRGVWPAFDLVELLNAYRHSTQWQRDVGCGGPLEHALDVHEGEGVQVAGLDGGQRRLGFCDG